LFILLLIPRSQQFHPWYLTWALVFIPWFPVLGNKLRGWERLPIIASAVSHFQEIVNWWAQTLVIFSITSLFRYLPWLQTGGFSDQIVSQQKMITWSAIIISLFHSLLVKVWPQADWRKI